MKNYARKVFMFQIQVETEAKVRGLNPAQGYNIDSSEIETKLFGVEALSQTRLRSAHKSYIQPMKLQRYHVTVSWQRLLVGSEPLLQEADPPIIKAQR